MFTTISIAPKGKWAAGARLSNDLSMAVTGQPYSLGDGVKLAHKDDPSTWTHCGACASLQYSVHRIHGNVDTIVSMLNDQVLDGDELYTASAVQTALDTYIQPALPDGVTPAEHFNNCLGDLVYWEDPDAGGA